MGADGKLDTRSAASPLRHEFQVQSRVCFRRWTDPRARRMRVDAARARRLNAPPHAIANFEGEVEDFKLIVDRMRTDLALLPEADRQAITGAAVAFAYTNTDSLPGRHTKKRGCSTAAYGTISHSFP
jgi:hypothetical protein